MSNTAFTRIKVLQTPKHSDPLHIPPFIITLSPERYPSIDSAIEKVYARPRPRRSYWQAMDGSLNIPLTIYNLRKKSNTPYTLGRICGYLMEAIPTLVRVHLDHRADYKSKRSIEGIDTQEFTAAVDTILAEMRAKDNANDPFPDALTHLDRKERRYRRKYCDRYIQRIKEAFGKTISEGLRPVLLGYSAEANQQFNKGFDYAHSRISWRVYPVENVAMEVAPGEDWSDWLRVRCENLGRLSLKMNLPLFDPMD